MAVIGATAITKSAVQHWSTALSLINAHERSLHIDESPPQQALSFLIASHWLVDEARRRGLGVADREVDRAVEEQEAELAFAALRRALALDEGKAAASSRRLRDVFRAQWTSRWKAQTDCRAGYVIDSCRQHPGPVAIEYPLSVDL